MIYLDNNATTRVPKHVVDAMVPYFSEQFLNPGSFAGELEGIDQIVWKAKSKLASMTGCRPQEYFLTSGATESNNWVLRSLAKQYIKHCGEFKLAVSAIEHPSILETAQDLAKDPNVDLQIIEVDQQGRIRLDHLKRIVSKQPHLLSIMLANNETGVVQDVEQLGELTKSIAPNCLFHTDATQALGKILVRLDQGLLQVDLLSLSAHKYHGPKGIGALFVREGVPLAPLITGGSQQSGMRSGTENTALTVGFAEALSIVTQSNTVTSLRDRMEKGILELFPSAIILSNQVPRLPNTSLVLLPGIEGELAVSSLYQEQIVTSTGSACSNGSDTPSHVITAMGVPFELARNALRLSLSNETTNEEINVFLNAMKSLNRLNS